MERRYLLGNEAIAHAAREVPVDFVCGYPGTPSSEVVDTLRVHPDPGGYIEWSVNEKVALENAIGASWCGLRALCTMKHVGLNVAADPLMTSAYTGVRGGLVIMSADDPFAHSSQNEQDSRVYAQFARVPCLDPSSVQEAHDMMRDAFALSEDTALPVIFRPTTRVCHSKSDVVLGEMKTEHRAGAFEKDARQFVVIPAHTRLLHKALNEKQPGIRRLLIEKGYNHFEIKGKKAVITGGIAASYVREVLPEGISLMVIGAYPIDDEWLSSFISRHKEVLVIEELAPVIEVQVRELSGTVPVYGKKTGHVPFEGEFSPLAVEKFLISAGFLEKNIFPEPRQPDEVPMRPPILCAGCMHRSAMYAIRRIFPDSVYPSDIGCYTLGLQMGTVDTTICMGASITIGSGMAHSNTGKPVVCTIGDSTFLHSGITGLLNAVYNGADMVVIILDNRVTAMTGHQPNPVTGLTATGIGSPPVSLEAICRSCGAAFVETASPHAITQFLEVLKAARDKTGVRVIIARQPCVISDRRAGVKRKPYIVDTEACTGCAACIRFGCPAIVFEEEKARITDLCSGCGVCAEICPSGAIRKEVRK